MTETPARPVTHTPVAQDVPARVLRAAALAPQFSWQRGWHVVNAGADWELHASDARAGLTQGQAVSAGSTAELLIVAREAEGRSSTLDVNPLNEEPCVLAVRDAGPAAAVRAHVLLAARDPDEPRELRPSDVRHLNLAAERYGCELLWQDQLGPRTTTPGLRRVHATADGRPLTTVVTPGDSPRDWVHAGRAAARCSLVARELGLTLVFGVHAFNGWATREEVRQLWHLSGWPQLQFSLEVPPSPGGASLATPRPE